MNNYVLQGRWNQIRGAVRETWGKLTKDELDQIAGDRRRLLGIIQEKYGYTEEEAERQLNEFLTNLDTIPV